MVWVQIRTTFCQSGSESKLFEKVISRWQKLPLARIELIILCSGRFYSVHSKYFNGPHKIGKENKLAHQNKNIFDYRDVPILT